MEDMKVTLKDIVTKRLAAAPESTAKSELIEELSENLFSRYTDLTAGGVSEEDARDRAVDALGDTNELVEYLKGLEPDQSLPEQVLDSEKADGGQIEEILHNVEDILRGAFQKAKTAFRDAKDAVKQGINTEDRTYTRKYDGELGELEQKIHDLETAMEENQRRLEAEEEALGQLENARDVLEAVGDQSAVEKALADIEVKIGAKEAEIEALEEAYAAMEEQFDALEEEFDALEEALDAEDDSDVHDAEITFEHDKSSDKGWKVTYEDKKGHSVEFGSDELKDSVKDMMKDIEQVIREATGMAKDITKSACKAAKEGSKAAMDAAKEGSKAAWEAAAAACTPDTAVEANQPIDAAQLKGIDVQTYGGDITVRMSQDTDGDVLVGGDIEDIEVFRSADGVLTIRPIKTETASFFFGRGIFNSSSSADVILDLPRRNWEFLKLSTTNGDVNLSGDMPVDQVAVSSVSGDINAKLPTCAKAVFRTTNGDIRWTGDVSDFRMESISGDVQFRGSADSVCAKTTSGDLTVEGSACAAGIKTVSGDVCLRSSVLPDKMDVVTTSGDMWIDIPDAGPFTAKFRSTSGDFTSDFFTGRMGGRSCTFTYQGGGKSQYNFASISGDVELRKYY